MALRMTDGVPVPRPSDAATTFSFGGAAPPLYPQEHSEWCWAACIQMVGDSPPLNVGTNQPDIVRTVKRGPCAESIPALGLCNDPANVDEIDDGYQAIGVAPQFVASSVTQARLDTALAAKRVVQIGWSNPGHVVLVVDRRHSTAGVTYVIHDPWPVDGGTIRYLQLDQVIRPSGHRSGALDRDLVVLTGVMPWRA